MAFFSSEIKVVPTHSKMFVDHLAMMCETLNLPFKENTLKMEYTHKEM